MKLLSFLFLLSFTLVEVTPNLLSIAKSVFEWTTDLGSRVPFLPPFFAQLNDDVALALLVHDSEKKYLNITTFAATGDRRANCMVPLIPLTGRIWDMRLTYLGESRVGLSWVDHDKEKLENRLRVMVAYLDNCAFSTVAVVVVKDIHFVYHVHYAVVPYVGGEFDIFVKSPTDCERGVCKIGFKTNGQEIVKNGEPISFLNNDDFSEWRVVPVEPYNPSKGFYFYDLPRDEKANSTIKKLSPNGTVLNSIEMKISDQEVIAHSNAYGNFGLCSLAQVNRAINCSLFDVNLMKLVQVSLPVDLRVNKISMGNDNQGGFLLLINYCLNLLHCHDHVTVARKITAKGEILDAGEFARSRDECYPWKDYDVSVDEKENVYCTGAPCMKKIIEETRDRYNVSVNIKCLKTL